MRFTLLLGATWALTFGAIAIPAASVNGGIVGIAVASHLVGVQVAQSVAVQLGGVGGIGWIPLWMWLVVLVMCGVGVTTGVPMLVPCATVAGVVGGLASGKHLVHLLNDGLRIQYQSFLFARSLAICLLAVAATVSLVVASPRVAAGVYCAVTSSLLLRRRRGSVVRGDPTPTAVALLGFGATLFYRNDVNYLRSQLLGDSEFQAWHLGLTIFAAVQAVAGTLMVHAVYAQRSAVRGLLARHPLRVSVVILGLAAAGACGSIALAFASAPRTAVGFACVSAAIVTVLSGVCHVLQTNWVPYIAGVLTAGLLVLMLSLGVDVSIAWGTQLLGLACCLAAGGILGLVRASRI